MALRYKPLVLAALLGAATSASAADWTVYGGDTGNTRFSEAKQITTENVGDMRVAWALQLGTTRAQESTPIVIDGTMYLTSSFGPKNTFAVDAKTGKIKWVYQPDVPRGIDQYACCDVNNRGVTWVDGKVVLGRLDAHIVALDSETGKEVWKTKIVDYKQGSVITSPPTYADGVIITGFGGGEYGVRGALVGLDPETGKELWRTHTVPGPGEKGHESWKGDSWKFGGGVAWFIGSYDPELNLVYYGTSNPAPWSASVRGNDSSDIGQYSNLYTASTLAIEPKTGEIKWHYQTTPHDAWDYDGVNELVFADLDVDGKKTPVLMKADRNGFFYVLERATGKLVSAEKFIAATNWATGIDLKTGMPIEAPNNEKRPGMKRMAKDICPQLLGGKNWHPMSYSKQTGLVYIPSQNMCMDMEGIEAEYKRGAFYLGVNFDLGKRGPGGYLGGVMAWDPVKQEQVWMNKDPLPYTGGLLTTAGGLAFHGVMDGEFRALDAKTGEKLWGFNTGSGVMAGPMTYEIDGQQYVAVVSGRTQSIPAFLGGIGEEMTAASPEGGTLFVFTVN